jgi:hypothetical protein
VDWHFPLIRPRSGSSISRRTEFAARPRLLDRTEAVELLEHEFPVLDLVHYRNLYDPTRVIADILTGISRAKDEVVDANTYLALAQAMRDRAVGIEDIATAEKPLKSPKYTPLTKPSKSRLDALTLGTWFHCQ